MSDLDLLRRLGDQIVPPPIDELRKTARRRTQRTATVTTLTAAAVVTSVLAGLHLAVSEHHSERPPVQKPEHSNARPLTYAEGTTLYFGEQSITMPEKVVEIDMVDGAVVARTREGGIWLTDGGAPEEIGKLGTPAAAFQPELPPFYYNDGVGFVVSSNSGPLTGWFEFPEPDQPELVVYDTASGEEIARQPIDVESGSGAVLTSVDEHYAYWDVDPQAFEDPAAVGRLDLLTGEQTMQDKPVAVRRGNGLQAAPPRRGTPRTILVSHREGGGGPYEADEGLLQFTVVHGRRLEPAGEQPLEVLDGVNRTPFSFAVPATYPAGDVFSFLIQWIDDDTIAMAAYRPNPDGELTRPPDLLVCQISTRACEVAAQSVDAVLPELGRPPLS
jgi:hypothetical protein